LIANPDVESSENTPSNFRKTQKKRQPAENQNNIHTDIEVK